MQSPGCALSYGLKETHTGCHRDIETRDVSGHRELYQEVTSIGRQSPHTGTFGTHDNDDRKR